MIGFLVVGGAADVVPDSLEGEGVELALFNEVGNKSGFEAEMFLFGEKGKAGVVEQVDAGVYKAYGSGFGGLVEAGDAVALDEDAAV